MEKHLSLYREWKITKTELQQYAGQYTTVESCEKLLGK